MKHNKSNLNIMTLKLGYTKSYISKGIHALMFLFSNSEEMEELIYK